MTENNIDVPVKTPLGYIQREGMSSIIFIECVKKHAKKEQVQKSDVFNLFCARIAGNTDKHPPNLIYSPIFDII